MLSDLIRQRISLGQRDFFDVITKRRVTVQAYDFDDGCTAYGYVWDREAEDHEYLSILDLSCLREL